MNNAKKSTFNAVIRALANIISSLQHQPAAVKPLVTLVSVWMLLACARVGSPVGGPKDTTPPKFLGANIDTTRVNVPVNIKELRLDFDEYVVLKEAANNLIISPPIKIKKIFPANLATKYVLLKWDEDLQPNTTYNFNFGSAIQDNNENNALPYFNFAFSTGATIDNLFISGDVFDGSRASRDTNAKPTVVGLYPANDSLNFAQKPYYITRVDEDGYFELNYLAPGKYRLVAFEDANGNSIYDTGKEKVAFLPEAIDLTRSRSDIQLSLSDAKKRVAYKESKVVAGGILFSFEGHPEKVEISAAEPPLNSAKVSHRPFSDTAYVWINNEAENLSSTETTRLNFDYRADTLRGKASVFYRPAQDNALTISNQESNVLPPNQPFVITANMDVQSLQTDKWTMTEDSTVAVPFNAKIAELNPMKILVEGDYKQGKSYRLTVPKNSVKSLSGANTVSKRFDFSIDRIENYGSVELLLTNLPAGNAPVIVQLLSTAEKVLYTRRADGNRVKFPLVKPATYIARLWIDKNQNGLADGADLALGTLAEPYIYFYKPVVARPLWELKEDWDLASKQRLDLSGIPSATPSSPEQPAPTKDKNILE